MKDYRLYTLFKNIDLKDKVILDCPSSTGYLSKKFIDKGVMDALLHVGFSNIRLIKMESCPNAKEKVMLDKQQDYLDQYFIECEKI
jgi:hypothetical protein